MTELPFKLYKSHKSKTKSNWKKHGLIMDNFEEIYKRYIYATHCELCNKEFVKSLDRQMEHDHKTGEFRNIVCTRCNSLKSDRKQCNNTSGYIGICKHTDKKYKQGYRWSFRVNLNGKQKTIKYSIDLEFLKKFAQKWRKENNYNT